MKHAIYITLRRCMLLIAFIGTVMLSGCGHHDEPTVEPPQPETPATSHTILVYMVASNNLQGFDKSDLDEIKLLYTSPEIDMSNTRMLVYQRTYSSAVLYEVTQDDTTTLKEYDSSELSVTVSRMSEVITDMKELAPANEYGLVLWSHATGWLQNGVSDTGDTQIPILRSYGSDNGNYMNITALATALEDAGFKYIYFDCCYMGGIEVIYQMRHCADYLIVSPAEDPTYGMRYDLTIPYLTNDALAHGERMVEGAKATFEYYNSTFTKGNCPCTLTVIRTDKIDQLADVTRTLYIKADRTVNPDHAYQKFKVSGTCHYYDFDEYVESICDDPQLLAQWRDALNEAILYEAHTPYIWNTPINRCCGLSTYILSSRLSTSNNGYNTLSWYTDVASALFK